MIVFKKISYLSIFVFVCAIAVIPATAQDRQRVVRTVSSQQINQPPAAQPAPERSRPVTSPTTTNSTRRILTNEITVAQPSLVTKTTSSKAINASTSAVRRSMYNAAVTNEMLSAIQNRLGIPYLYGSSGPNRYDCSGFVWAVFGDAGMNFTRSSARSLWEMSEPVTGDEKYLFGTLVFMNRLGHMGIVADSEGFYHASTSKGIIYSRFDGYWKNRIVGFRKLTVPTIEELR